MTNLVKQETNALQSTAFSSVDGFEAAQRMAKAMASSNIVPKQFQGNLANCLIAIELGQRIGASPLAVAQNMYIVHGQPTWSAQFMIATFNRSGRFHALRYRFTGEQGKDSWGCVAYAIEKDTEERLEGSEVTIALAKKEGWYTKPGSKWQTMPQQMLMYRAASWFIRAYAPEIAMGLYSRDEIIDIGDISHASAQDSHIIDVDYTEGINAHLEHLVGNLSDTDTANEEPTPDVDTETGEIIETAQDNEDGSLI